MTSSMAACGLLVSGGALSCLRKPPLPHSCSAKREPAAASENFPVRQWGCPRISSPAPSPSEPVCDLHPNGRSFIPRRIRTLHCFYLLLHPGSSRTMAPAPTFFIVFIFCSCLTECLCC